METLMDKNDRQVIVNTINTLANLLMNPEQEAWRIVQTLDRVEQDLGRVAEHEQKRQVNLDRLGDKRKPV